MLGVEAASFLPGGLLRPSPFSGVCFAREGAVWGPPKDDSRGGGGVIGFADCDTFVYSRLLNRRASGVKRVYLGWSPHLQSMAKTVRNSPPPNNRSKIGRAEGPAISGPDFGPFAKASGQNGPRTGPGSPAALSSNLNKVPHLAP